MTIIGEKNGKTRTIKVLEAKSTHAFADEALLILSLDPRAANSRNYLKSAVKNNMLKAYRRGKVTQVYDRADLDVLAKKLDAGHVLINTANYELVWDFDYKNQES